MGGAASLSQYSWRLLNTPTTKGSWRSATLILQCVSQGKWRAHVFDDPDISIFQYNHENSHEIEVTKESASSKAFEFLQQCLSIATDDSPSSARLVKLILPLQKGYIARSDIIPHRLQDFEPLQSVVSFAEPLSQYTGIDCSTSNDLSTLLANSVCGLLARDSLDYSSISGFEAMSLTIDSELGNRLSLPWIIPEAPRRKTLVLVDANSGHPGDGAGLYHAAKVLGIDLVVLDNEGHWLQDDAYSHLRTAFIPTKIANPPEEDLTQHILGSIRAYGKPVDGILTFADTFWYYVAQAANEIGLKTCPPDAFRTATNKYLTSVFVGHQAYKASSVSEALDIAANNDLPYPLIVKPCGGWSSEGVSRIDSAADLPAAVAAINTSRVGFDFVMEKYCSGPEVDVNLVLLDGEVLFCEVCDDLPKTADLNSVASGPLTNFHELDSAFPSALPAQEVKLLQESFSQTLLKLGITDGVMHLEGRVENSTVEYKRSTQGIVELEPIKHEQGQTQQSQPSAWLIEINPRPPGMTASQIVESTYGIDYWGLTLLIGVDDKARAKALSKPFTQGSQYNSVMVFISADYPISAQGIFDSEDMCTDLKARRPDLAKHISRCGCLVRRGDQIPHPSTGRNIFLAYFNVFSRTSRQEALQIAKVVREETKYSFL